MRVLIAGPISPEELGCFPEDVEVTVLAWGGLLTPDDLRDAVARVKPDYALFLFHANQAINARKLKLRKLKCPKAAWFIDTHVEHCRQQELRVAKYFDIVFLAHSPYLDHFRKHRDVRWLPCALYASENPVQVANRNFALNRLAASPPVAPEEFEYDICFTYREYGALHPGYPSRRSVLDSLEPVMDDLGLRRFLGEDRDTPFQRMSRSRACLNVSIADDFNIRNLEVLALGRPLITNRTPDHARVAGIDEFCHYFDPADPETFRAIVSKLDGIDNPELVRRRWEYVIGGHTTVHRVLEMLGALAGTSFVPRIPGAGQQA